MVEMASMVMERMVRARVLQLADAEDIVQDLAAQVLEGRLTSVDRVRAGELPMSHWLSGVFERRRRGLWRERHRARNVEAVDDLAAPVASESDPTMIAESQSTADMERLVIERLPPRERAIVEARLGREQLPAIAARLGITERSVRRGWMRALQRARAWRTSGSWRNRSAIGVLSDESVQQLSERQREVYRLARAGLPRSRIAESLRISPSTVSNDLARLRVLARGGASN
jgi:RNA polymerase sigma factor (sigma-70 family)